MHHIVTILLLVHHYRLYRSQITFMRHLKDMFQISVPQILLGYVHLVTVVSHLPFHLHQLIDLTDPFHHVNQVTEKCLCPLELEFVTLSLLFILLALHLRFPLHRLLLLQSR